MEKSATNSKQEVVLSSIKKLFLYSVFIPLFFSSCDEKRTSVGTWTEFEPVYMTEEEFKNSVATESPRDLEEPGKIYIYQEYLFVNEINEGIHIFDNTNPAAPVNLGFINIPANKDLAIKDELLYADSHSDLLVFDISDVQNPILLHREEEVYNMSSLNLGYPYQQIDPSKGIVVDWKEVKMKEVCDEDSQCGPRWGWGWGGGSFFNTLGVTTSNEFDAAGGGNIGKGGSMARFTISGDFLYAVDNESLTSFDISNPDPVTTDSKTLGWGIETIFPYGDHLYIGSRTAMYIFDITTPSSPEGTAQYNHFTACDPVVVQNDIAYVTLRSGQFNCQRNVNRLEVIDVEDPENPTEMKTYEMQNPHGLGIDGNYLFVSEGDNGIKIMDATDPQNITEIRFVQNIKSFDVIPFNNVLMVTGKSGILQYDYSNIQDIKLLSTIPVVKEDNS
ncbi:MAG: hypothetical protein CL670_16520 [Balneola sp.]|jgi:hypothetical protein|nr:hypothetical protein [Balneola sp.]MBE80766.1 hypothetical protein [Balneola sp.]|tara:strand:+ start:1338 stop:2675 length:1338 start_codon:yes stop_codon:yes gene_type:complete